MLFRTSIVALVFLAGGLPVADALAAPPIEITSCAQPGVSGRAFLSSDLECVGLGAASAIVLDGRTKLELNGFTVRSGVGEGVLCLGNKRCKIIGPGTIADSGIGVHSTNAILIDVDIVNNGRGIEAESCGRVKLKDSIITNSSVVGIRADRSVKLTRSTVIGSGTNGVQVIGDDECPRTRLKLRHSEVTSSGSDTACGVSITCADLASLEAPKVRGTSTCETSYDLNSGFPGMNWGICSSD